MSGRSVRAILIAVEFLVLASAPAAFGVDRIYWGNGNDTISYANLDGSGGGGELNVSGATPSGPRGVAIDQAAGRLYWANQGNDTISYANLDNSGGGGELDTSGATVDRPHGLVIHPAAGRIYWANDDDTIAYANLDGSGGGGQLNIAGAPSDGPYGVTIDPAAGRAYWANRGTNTGVFSIAYANLDGSGGGGELDITGAIANKPHGVTIDPVTRRIYWTNLDSTIFYASLDGGGGGQLNTAGATDRGGIGMAIDPVEGRIYWGNLGGNTISYAKLDGTGGGGELDITGSSPSNPRFVALLRSPSGTGAPQIAGGSSVGSTLACAQGGWAPDLIGSFVDRAPQSFAYQWSRNGAELAGATEATYTAAVRGHYGCRVTATNGAGSAVQTSDLHHVSAPSAVITRRPGDKTRKRKVTFEFVGPRAAALAGFRCSLDGAAFMECASPHAVRVKKGRHIFKVQAIDQAGSVGAPATDRWTVKRRRWKR